MAPLEKLVETSDHFGMLLEHMYEYATTLRH